MRVLSATLGAALAQDLFLSATPAQSCATRDAPSTDPRQQFCYLVKKNKDTYDISWAPPGLPPATFQDHILYDLVSLYNLGANASRLQEAFDFHVKTEMLDPAAPSTGFITADNWKQHIGENNAKGPLPSKHYSDYVDFYRQEISKRGAEAALAEFIPALVDGLFSSLFHGLLTLGWGWGESGDEEALAQGLAWMSTAFYPPTALADAPSRSGALKEALSDMRGDKRLPVYTQDPQAFYYPILADLVANHSQVMQEYDVVIPENTPTKELDEVVAEMQHAVLLLFQGSNFTSYTNVHMIEACRVSRSLLPKLPPAVQTQLIRRLWQAVVFNFAIQSRPQVGSDTGDEAARSWDQIVAGAFEQGDTHLHNLVWSGVAESKRSTGDAALYQTAADKALALFEAGGKWNF